MPRCHSEDISNPDGAAKWGMTPSTSTLRPRRSAQNCLDSWAETKGTAFFAVLCFLLRISSARLLPLHEQNFFRLVNLSQLYFNHFAQGGLNITANVTGFHC